MPKPRLLPTLLAVGLLPSLTLASVRVSDSVPGHTAAQLSDGDLRTAWVLPKPKDGKDPWIEVTLPSGPVVVDGLSMTAGWERDAATWEKHPRVQTVHLAFVSFQPDGRREIMGTRTATLSNERGVQHLSFDAVRLASPTLNRAQITLVEIQPGEEGKDLAVSEAFFHLQDTPTPAVWRAPAGIREVSDGDPKTLFKAETGATLTAHVEGRLVTRLGIRPGPSQRPETVWVTVEGITRQHRLEDKAEVQWIDLPVCHGAGHTGSCSGPVTLELTSSHGPGDRVQVAELQLMAASADP